MNTKQAAVMSIDSLLRQIAAETEKRAAAESEAGGYQGETSHPSKSVDDNTQPASEGARSKENAKDVKEQEGPASVEGAGDNPGGSVDKVMPNIGVRQSATGEDPSIETESAKRTKDDPGTSMPAKAKNEECGKCASYILQATKQAADLGTSLIAGIANEANGEVQKKAAAMQGQPAPAQADAEKAAAAGAELAAAMTSNVPQWDKQAEDAALLDEVTDTIQFAFERAEKTAAYLNEYFAACKQAEEEEAAKDGKPSPFEGSGDSEVPPAAAAGDDAGGAPAGGAGDEELLKALSGGGQDIGGGEALQGMAGDGAAPAGPGPEAGMDAGGGPGAGGELPPEEEMKMLLQILQQLGITPEELQAAAVNKQAEAIIKAAKAKTKPAVENWQPKTAAQIKHFRATLDYVRELTGR